MIKKKEKKEKCFKSFKAKVNEISNFNNGLFYNFKLWIESYVPFQDGIVPIVNYFYEQFMASSYTTPPIPQ